VEPELQGPKAVRQYVLPVLAPLFPKHVTPHHPAPSRFRHLPIGYSVLYGSKG